MIRSKKKGFSLIELIVVMAIMAILVLIAAPRYLGYTKDATEKRIESDVKAVNNSLAEYMAKNNDRIPVDSQSIDTASLISYVDAGKVYNEKGCISSIDETSTYNVLSSAYTIGKVNSKLSGTFVASEGGDVYYIDKNYAEFAEDLNTPTIKLVDSSNPDNMIATMTFSPDSISQEYKIGNGTWTAASVTTAKNNFNPFVMSVSAAEEYYTCNISVPNGSVVYARATFEDGKKYEANTKPDSPSITLSTTDMTTALTADIPSSEKVVEKEYRIGNGAWQPYSDNITIDKNATVYIKGKDIKGNIVVYSTVEISNIIDITWYGLPNAAFDNNISTVATPSLSDVITWKGDLAGKVIHVKTRDYDNAYLRFQDSNGNYLPFLFTDGTYAGDIASYSTMISKVGIIVPDAATRIRFDGNCIGVELYDIYEDDDIQSVSPVTDISAVPTKTTIALKWLNPTESEFKTVWVFRNGTYLGMSSNGTYTDAGLASNTSYTYQLRAQDITGNLSTIASYTAKTLPREIYWSGLDPAAFDANPSTFIYPSSSNIITWTGNLAGKIIMVNVANDSYPLLRFRNSAGNYYTFYFADGVCAGNYTSFADIMNHGGKIIVPDAADRIVFERAGNAILYDIYEPADILPASPVTNISSVPTRTAMTLTWSNPTDADFKTVWVYRNGTYLGKSSNGTYADAGLASNTSYTYQLRTQDTTGNLSAIASYTAKTLSREIYWSGLDPAAFDANPSTFVYPTSNNIITWTGDLAGKTINVNVTRNTNHLLRFRDAAGNYPTFYFGDGKSAGSYATFTDIMDHGGKIVVPATANRIVFENAGAVALYDIYESSYTP